MKIQQQIFADNEKELTKAEYDRLLTAAKNKQNERLYYLMQTIGSTGIRVSELEYVTCEAVALGQVRINCKGKIRVIFLPKQLCKMLKIYIKQQKITGGSVFVSKNGKPLDRSNIWKMMKALCKMTLNQHTINCYFLPLISYSIFLGRKTTDKCNKISCRRSRKQFHNGRGVQIDMCKVTYFVTSFFDF
ncbi:MAG: tyrosine-type recombinase/integrase [Clostridiales bacterium]|nr:tyrosine-type recombinase/integrase [Clostridiales bacterium]